MNERILGSYNNRKIMRTMEVFEAIEKRQAVKHNDASIGKAAKPAHPKAANCL